MPGVNTTGLPDSDSYSLGRGKLMAAVLSTTTSLPTGPYRDLGNCPDFKISVTEETLKHKSSIQGLKYTDKEVVISQELNCSLSLDEINNENLALLFGGTQTTITNPSKTAVTTPVSLAVAGSLVSGRWYELLHVSYTGNRLYDIDATKITFVTTETVPVTLVKDTDYLLDLEFGMVFFITTSAKVITCLAATKTVTFTTTAMSTAADVETVRALQNSSVAVTLKFLAENPANGDVRAEFQFNKISLKANGDFSLIGDDWTKMDFTGVAESNTAMDANSPVLTVRNLVAA